MRPTALLMHVFAIVLCTVLASVAATPTAPSADALAKRDPSPVEARAPAPAPSNARRTNQARAPAPSGALRKRKQQVLSPEEAISQHLCPRPMRACPLSPASAPTTLEEWISDGFECVDNSEDLTSCGGCGLSEPQYDCTSIEGAVGVSCVIGTCHVDSCAEGYVRSLDGKSCVKAR